MFDNIQSEVPKSIEPVRIRRGPTSLRTTWFAVLIVAASAAQYATSANAQTSRDQAAQWCEGKDQASADRQIGGCTYLIQSGRESGAELATWFSFRSGARLRLGDMDKAIEDAEEGVRVVRDWHSLLALARAKMGGGDREGGMRNANAAVEAARSAGDITALRFCLEGRGQIRQEIGDLSGSLEDLSAAIAIRPSRSALALRALVKRRLGDRAGADSDSYAAQRQP